MLNHLKTLMVVCIFLETAQFGGAIMIADYQFDHNLHAKESGVASLIAVDPLGANHFTSDTVFGKLQTVYRWDGNPSPPSQQAGLTFTSTTLLSTNKLYSIEMILSIDSNSGWRRLVDVQNRTSDNGFYIDPSKRLGIFPVTGSNHTFTALVYHHLVLVDNNSKIDAYLDGVQEITSFSTTIMDVNNSGNLIHLFLDNTAGGGQGEFTDGKIALFRVYDSALSGAEVTNLAAIAMRKSAGSAAWIIYP